MDAWENLSALRLDIEHSISELYNSPAVPHESGDFLTRHYENIARYESSYQRISGMLDNYRDCLAKAGRELTGEVDPRRQEQLEKRLGSCRQADGNLTQRLKKVFKSVVDCQKAEKERYELFGGGRANSEEAGFIRAGRVASETVNVGKTILENLQAQSDSLGRIDSNLEGLLQTMGISQSLASMMARRVK
jgi:hypothetical protein